MTVLRQIRDKLYDLIYNNEYPLVKLKITDITKYCRPEDKEVLFNGNTDIEINRKIFKPTLLLTNNDSSLMMKLYHEGSYIFITLIITHSGKVIIKSNTYQIDYVWDNNGYVYSNETNNNTQLYRNITPVNTVIPMIEIDITGCK